MKKENNLKPFQKGQDSRRNLDGRPIGSRNRSTILRELLDQGDNEYLLHKAQLEKALNGDINSYKTILDNVYGKQPQESDLTDKKDSITIISVGYKEKNCD